MTSWVLAISGLFPEHWGIAKENRLWDLRTRRGIRAGDVVYFWLAKASFVGRVEVTHDVRPIQSSDPIPWLDASTTRYVVRFFFENPLEPVAEPRWNEVQRYTGIRGDLRGAPHSDEPQVEEALRTYFESTGPTRDAVDLNFATEKDARVVLANFEKDERTVSLAALKLRRGQSGFRSDLLAAYEGCAITGTSVPGVLEAAHISPYRGEHTNLVRNGLLLRADIHTLFDLHELTIEPHSQDAIIRLSEALRSSDYGDLDGKRARLPRDPMRRPAEELLRQHNHECGWLIPATS